MFLAWSLPCKLYKSPGAGEGLFRFVPLRLGSFSVVFRQAWGCVSQEMTVHFLTIQEEPLKILMSSKQTACPCPGQGGRISPRGQETGSSGRSQLFVFTRYLLLQIWGMTQDLSLWIWVGSIK